MQWTLEPALAARGEYNDNIRLTTTAADALWSQSTSAAAKIEGRTPLAEVSGNLRYEALRFPSEAPLDSDNWRAGLGTAYRSTLDTWRLDADYSADSTLETELLDTGLTQVSKRRHRWSATPSWSRRWSETTEVQLNAGWVDVAYDDSVVNLIDYSYRTLSATLAQQWRPQTQWSTTLYASRYRSDDDRSEFDDLGLQAGIRHGLSARTQLRLTAGARQTDTRVRLGTPPLTTDLLDEGTGALLDAGLEYRDELTTWQAGLSRSVQPSGAGYLQQTDQWRLGWRRRLAATLNLDLQAAAYRNKALAEGLTNQDRRYYRTEARLQWRWARTATLDGYYRYRRQRYDRDADAADGNIVGVALQYRWPQRL